MLTQMIPSADAIGQTGSDTSRAMGACKFSMPAALAHAAILNRASGSGSEGWKTSLWKLRKVQDVLARTARDLEDDARRR
jgi:hypothetical protein